MLTLLILKDCHTSRCTTYKGMAKIKCALKLNAQKLSAQKLSAREKGLREILTARKFYEFRYVILCTNTRVLVTRTRTNSSWRSLIVS